MPFLLKNAGAPYKITKAAFSYYMRHKKIKVSIDDMIAKSITEEDHLADLKKVFERLKRI